MTNHRQRNAIAIAYIMGGDCQVCHYNESIKSLHCHHLNPSEKEFNISQRFILKKKWSEIEIELKKCIQLCSNCHAEYHAGLITIPQESSFSEVRLNEVRTRCKKCNNFVEEIGHEFCSQKCKTPFTQENRKQPNKESFINAKEVWSITNVIDLLDKYNGNMSLASKQIGVSSKSVKRRFKKVTDYPNWKAYQATLANS